MAVTTPSLRTTAAFDAKDAHTFTFTSIGGNQIVANRLIIKDAASGTVVYDRQVTTGEYAHTVPANTLLNSTYYQATVSVYDVTGAQSAQSSPIQFWCFTTPEFIFSNITEGGIISTSSYSFVVQYDQREGELMNAYVFFLYDENERLIWFSDLNYVGSTVAPPTFVAWTVEGLEDGATYKIKCTGGTVYGTAIDTGLVTFSVQYDTPIVNIPIELTSKCDDGYVQIHSASIDPLGGTDALRIKRRKDGDFEWTTLYTTQVDTLHGYNLTWRDNLAQSDVLYEYAIVPMLGGTEGRYVTAKIKPTFNGVFICERDAIYKLYEGVAYGSNDRVHKTGVFETFGRKYPVIVSNAQTNYNTGSVSGMILPDDYMENGVIDRVAIVNKRNDLLDFFTNKRPKIIKDFNSNIWLVLITGNPSVSFSDNYGMGVASISAAWTEIGDPNSAKDLYSNGMIDEV